jgi:NADH-quinone oxidoreductase subunit C
MSAAESSREGADRSAGRSRAKGGGRQASSPGREPAGAASALPTSLASGAAALEKRFGGRLLERVESRGELTYVVASADWVEVLGACKLMRELAFDQLDCLLGDHLPARTATPFQVVAHLVSHTHGHRLRIKTALAEGQRLATVTALWPSAGFDERETWEMFGIEFEGHPYLRRLLTTDDFEGFPLRKDFPLQGTVGGRVRTDLRGKI